MEAFRASILLVDDEESNLMAMQKILEHEAYRVTVARQAAAALTLAKRQAFDLVLTDLRMPGVSGLELLRAIRQGGIRVPVVILTAFGTVNDAVEAMKLGAVDFLSKPIRREMLLKVIQDVLSRAAGDAEAGGARNAFIGGSAAMSQVKRTIKLLARTNASVLIEGESGTGKEVVAKAIHAESGRRGRMVSVNCGAIPENLLESELFGYERGAFTGAVSFKQGLFEVADQGTLFLDEVGEMPMSLQVKLLRVLQDSSFFRLGGTEQRRVDARIIAATNCDLKEKIACGQFREDLFYRLNVISLAMPPLRERGEDLLDLAEHFLALARHAHGRNEVSLSADAKAAILRYSWPGNVRELRNAIERTVVMLDGTIIHARDLGLAGADVKRDVQAPMVAPAAEQPFLSFAVGTSLHEMELEAIRRTLAHTGGDKAKAAELLGINQRTIYRRLSEL